ncbi:MAG: Flp pilus assembly complex ATPase component TadA [Clostridiales bacterium]|nr:Flp pilus assembly complex ATPase component TadA [Clostridiales bacterium]
MAELRDRLDITVEELEESLGANKLPRFIESSEKLFVDRIDTIINDILSDPRKRAICVSGPTSSGKTTFTMRLSSGLNRHGKKAFFLSLDDYYTVRDLTFDRDGRPDFETIEALDIERAANDIKRILNQEAVTPPHFNFMTRQVEEGTDTILLPEDGVLVVEGLHGLSSRITGGIDDALIAKVFIMPYGNVYADSKLMDSNEIRLLRRIVRDNRHRSAHALSTIDYWPMIERSEEDYYTDYLTRADYHVNSFLAYESLIIAPMALADIRAAQKQALDGTIAPNIFMDRSNTGKPFADLNKALARAGKLVEHLEKIPVVDPKLVPEVSILNEFIGS